MSKVAVLGNGWVELQARYGTWHDIVSAARTSYLGETKGEEADKKLLYYLYRNQHMSPFEMQMWRFRLRVPIMVARQLMRYRTAKVNEMSGRYVEYDEEFYVPKATDWRGQSKSNKQASSGTVTEAEQLDALTRIEDKFQYDYAKFYHAADFSEALEMYVELGQLLYKSALDAGVAREMARLFLPGFATYTTIVFMIDTRNLFHIFDQRLQSDAQYETREAVRGMYTLFSQSEPELDKLYREG